MSNKGVIWSEETLFEYLENPKKVRCITRLRVISLTMRSALQYIPVPNGLCWLEEGEGQE